MESNWSEAVRWRDLVNKAEKETERVYQLLSPITDEQVREIETALNLEFPIEMLSLYRATNGISELLDGEIIGTLVWSSDEIIERNLEMRKEPDFSDLYMPFDCLLFFADVGNGDLFGIPVLNHKCPKNDIFIWNHEDDSRTWIAGNLFRFMENWSMDNLEV